MKKARMVLLYIMIILFFKHRCYSSLLLWKIDGLNYRSPNIWSRCKEIQTQLKNIGYYKTPLTVYMIKLLPNLSRIFKRRKVYS